MRKRSGVQRVNKTLLFVLSMMLVLPVVAVRASAAQEPAIKEQASHWTLELPKRMQKAIQAFNQDFRP